MSMNAGGDYLAQAQQAMLRGDTEHAAVYAAIANAEAAGELAASLVELTQRLDVLAEALGHRGT
jgi:hypothetical protein